jgi:hypothetical protein
MLRSAKDVNGYAVAATDGDLGSVHDLFFDDEAWVVRYVVVDTGRFLTGRLVLVSPISVHRSDWVFRQLHVSLTREQVRNSPPIDTHRPVSRQQEQRYLWFYGYRPYWGEPGLWGPGAVPAAMAAAPRSAAADPAIDDDLSAEQTHLRSCREVAGYALHATDGDLGHVEDFLFDDLDWAIRYLVIDTRNWWFGRKVLIAPEWVEGIDWTARNLVVDVSREAVTQAPEYDAGAHVNRQWEADYYAHHRRPPYWTAPQEARRIKARHFRPPVITK